MVEPEELRFNLTFPRLRTSGWWMPRETEVPLCRDIVARVTYPIPAWEAKPQARYVTLAKFFYDAMDAVRAMPPKTLPAASNGALLVDSLAVFLMDATVPANEIVHSGWIISMSDETARKFADELEPGVVAFRRAIGTVGGAAESFWTPAALGEGDLYNIQPRTDYEVQTAPPQLPDDPESELEPKRRRRWWRRHG